MKKAGNTPRSPKPPADVHEAIRQGLDDVAHGRTRPAHEVFNEIRRQYRIPRFVPSAVR